MYQIKSVHIFLTMPKINLVTNQYYIVTDSKETKSLN